MAKAKFDVGDIVVLRLHASGFFEENSAKVLDIIGTRDGEYIYKVVSPPKAAQKNNVFYVRGSELSRKRITER